jgi:hypothetical protein
MPDDLQALRESVRQLSERLDRVEARLGLTASAEPAGPEETPSPAGLAPSALVPAGLPALLGRTLIVFGGGFLLRALTDSGALPVPAGVVAGLAYAACWLALSHAAGRRDDRLSAAFHGVTAVALAFPLILEATLRFHLVGAAGSGLAILLGGLSALLVASRHRLASVAWLGVGAAVASILTLLVATRDLIPLTLALLALAAGVEALAAPGWITGLRWLVAAAANLAIVILTPSPRGPKGSPRATRRCPRSS